MNEHVTWQQQEVVRLLKQQPGTQYQEADDNNKTIMRDWVRSLLQKQPITVTFVKADGSERAMNCTLSHDLIPPTPVAQSNTAGTDAIVAESKKPQKPAAEPDLAVIKVYDLEVKSWRSFRMDRLKKITADIVFDTK